MDGNYQSGNILRWVDIKAADQGIGCTNATPYLEHVTTDRGGVNFTTGNTTLWAKNNSFTGNTTVGNSYIDASRMGVTGGSYGGYMTNWIIGHTHRFKAAVTERCLSNLISMWGSSDFNWTF